jgi:hypothetical protein
LLCHGILIPNFETGGIYLISNPKATQIEQSQKDENI